MNDILYDNVTPYLEEVAERLRNTKPLMRAAGMALRDSLRAHFIGRNNRPGFWADVAAATVLEDYDESSATVAVTGEYGPILAHKINGGPIYAKNVKNLAIPAIPEAKKAGYPSGGATPPLVCLFTMKGGKLRAYALAEKGKDGRIWYWLKSSVMQKPDPDALPSQAETEADVIARMGPAIDSLLATS